MTNVLNKIADDVRLGIRSLGTSTAFASKLKEPKKLAKYDAMKQWSPKVFDRDFERFSAICLA